jgi:hypothetical protein
MVTTQVEAVVMEAMAKNMGDRPSAAEMAYRFGKAVGRGVHQERTVPVVPPPPLPAPPGHPARGGEGAEPTHLIDSGEIQEVVEEPRGRHHPPLADELREPLTLAELAQAFDAPADEEPTALEPPSDRNRSSMRKLLDKLFDSES